MLSGAARAFTLTYAASLLSAANANAANEWFENTDVGCFGNQAVGAAAEALAGGGIKIKSGSGPGKYYVDVTALDLLSMKKDTSDQISDLKSLDVVEAKDLRTAINNSAEGGKVPLLINISASFGTGILFSGGSGAVAGILLSMFFDKLNALSADLKTLGHFIADGGEVYRRSVPIKNSDSKNNYLLSSTEYRVSVGKETRSFVLHACAYPIKVIVSEFYTLNAPFGQDQILKPQGGDIWKIWDVKESKWYGDPYKFVAQGSDYYYFEKDRIENDTVVGKDSIRVSFSGGDWMIKRPGDADYKYTNATNVFGR